MKPFSKSVWISPAACGARVPLFYGSDDQLEMLYRHRERLEEHFKLLLNGERLAWALHDMAAVLLEQGQLEHWVAFYKDVLGFHQSHQEMVWTKHSAMNSNVMPRLTPTATSEMP